MNTKLFCLHLLFLLPLLVISRNDSHSDTTRIFDHLERITRSEISRNHLNSQELNRVAQYIYDVFSEYSDSTSYQYFKVRGRTFKNVICSFGTEHSRRLIVGAHYDVCEDQEGADDNASGVVGLLELARLLSSERLDFRIDLVAYTLEEPPFFRTDYMGSFVHARSLCDQNADVIGMICLEMIGYFKVEKKTQDYPIGMMSWFYGSRGNYIALVKKWGAGSFARKFKAIDQIKTKKLSAPKSVPGIDFSDHRNYWRFDFSAIMITDTAFYRNKNYHEKSDTMETLNIPMMGKVIDSVFLTILKLKV